MGHDLRIVHNTKHTHAHMHENTHTQTKKGVNVGY